jgi:hypothetical protein
MADTQSLRQVAHSRTPFSAWLGVVLLFALFGVIVLAVIGPSPRGDNYERKRAKEREAKLKTLREEDAKALTNYAWVDPSKGVARIPIERAMELTLAELAQKKPTAAGPIATPEPQASVAATGVTGPSPAPAASPQQTGTPKPTSVAGPKSENRNQPAGAANPPAAPPGTQPGAAASPAGSPAAPASPAASAAKPDLSPSPANVPTPPGSPLPVPGKTPGGT